VKFEWGVWDNFADYVDFAEGVGRYQIVQNWMILKECTELQEEARNE